MKEILQVCAYAAPYEGNFIKSIKAITERMLALGFKTIFAFPENAKNIGWCQELQVKNKVYFLPEARARIKPQTYIQMRKIFIDNPNIVIAHSHFELYDIPIKLMSTKDIRVFWHLHDAIGASKSKKDRIFHRIQYGIFNGGVKLLSVSQKHMDYALSLGFPKQNAKYVPNGLDTERIRRVDASRQMVKYDFGILGWEYYRKGVDLCIEACKNINPCPEVLVVATKAVESIVKSNGLSNVQVTKSYADVNDFFRQIHCFLHISRAEGLSYALLEAIYAGLPVICSDIQENQFATIFKTVKMVKSECIPDIVVAMQSITRPTEENIDDARKLIEERFSIRTWVDTVSKEYLE